MQLSVMQLRDLLERLDRDVIVELLVSNGCDIIDDCTDWNEIRSYENSNVLEISTDDSGTLIVTI